MLYCFLFSHTAFFIAYLHEHVILTFEMIQTILFNVIRSPVISLTLLPPVLFVVSTLVLIQMPEKIVINITAPYMSQSNQENE